MCENRGSKNILSIYIKQIQSDVETIDTVDEIYIDPFVLTTYQINDYVLRRYPTHKN